MAAIGNVDRLAMMKEVIKNIIKEAISRDGNNRCQAVTNTAVDGMIMMGLNTNKKITIGKRLMSVHSSMILQREWAIRNLTMTLLMIIKMLKIHNSDNHNTKIMASKIDIVSNNSQLKQDRAIIPAEEESSRQI